MIQHPSSLLSLLTLAGSIAVSHGLQINEIRINEPGDDLNEFVEIKGDPGQSLDNVWYLVVGDHSGPGASKGTGTIEYAIDLSGLAIPRSGLFVLASNTFALAEESYVNLRESIIFENSDNVTHILCRGYTGTEVLTQSAQEGNKAVDIDDNNDGIPNAVLPWEEILDAVGIVAPNTEEFPYGAQLGFVDVGPDGANAPGMVYRASDNNKWQIGDFDINPDFGSVDSPGRPNPIAFKVSGVIPNHASVGSKISVKGESLGSATSVLFDQVEAEFTVINDEELEVIVPQGAINGLIYVTNPNGTRASPLEFIVSADNVIDLFYENFENGTNLGQARQFSFTSEKDWVWSSFGGNGFAVMNGFGAKSASNDWLIVGPIDLKNKKRPFLQFMSARNFEGPALQVKVSKDYPGTGSPSVAAWTNLDALLSQGKYEWVSSGPINLSNYIGETIHIAFQYTSNGGDTGQGATIQVDEIWVYADRDMPASIFAAYDLALNYRVTGAGFLYDKYYPFVYSANLQSWWYIFDLAGDGTDRSYYFYDFKTEHFCYTSNSFYPFYFEFDGTPGGTAKIFP